MWNPLSSRLRNGLLTKTWPNVFRLTLPNRSMADAPQQRNDSNYEHFSKQYGLKLTEEKDETAQQVVRRKPETSGEDLSGIIEFQESTKTKKNFMVNFGRQHSSGPWCSSSDSWNSMERQYFEQILT